MEAVQSQLQDIVPAKISEFRKLEKGEPYHFDRWEKDSDGRPCLYYWFNSRDRNKRNVKRVPVFEFCAVLDHIRQNGAFTRSDYQELCPVAQSAGPCGYAVIGRLLEALGAAQYQGRINGFVRNHSRR